MVTSLSFRKSTILHFLLPDASSLGMTKIGEFQGLVLGSICHLATSDLVVS